MPDDLATVLADLEALPEGVQDEVRRALRVVLDAVGAGTVRLIEAIAEGASLDDVAAEREVRALFELCGLQVPTTSVVSLTSRPTCELCRSPMGSVHGHIADVDDRRLLCVCRGCELTVHGDGRYRSLPDEVEVVADATASPSWWTDLDIPVELAFFIRGSHGVAAFYPGAAGVVESELGIDDFPVELAPDVEALLVRDHERFTAWRVPVDRCYELAGLLRHASSAMPPSVVTDPFFDRLTSWTR